MTMRTIVFGMALIGSLAVCSTSQAQTLSGAFAINPVQVGQTITLTFTDTTGNGYQAGGSSCFGRTVLGSPGGPIVYTPMLCTTDLFFVAPNGTWTVTWDQLDNTGAQVAPGTYWFSVAANGVTNYFPITIQATPQDPALTQATPAQVNQYLTLSLQSPLDPSASYWTLFSLTTNVGFHSSVGFVSLDQDDLFWLSVADQPAWMFGNTTGTLDGTGNSPTIALKIPNLPALAYSGIAAQSLLLRPSGQFALTNPLVFTIAP